MKFLAFASWLGFGMTLAGCAAIDRYALAPAAESSRVPPLFRTQECEGTVIKLLSNADAASIDLTSWRNPFSKSPCEAQVESISLGQGKKDSSEVPPLKDVCPLINPPNAPAPSPNQLKNCAAFLEMRSDQICNIHLSKIFGNRAVTNVTLGTLATASGIAGSLTSGGTANALAGSAAFLTADRSLFNEEVYRNYVAEAVIKEIKSNRDNAKDAIHNEIEAAEGTSQRRINGYLQVVQRVTAMHNQCSFYDGLTSLVGRAGNDGERRAADLRSGVDSLSAYAKAEIDAITAKLKDPALLDRERTRLTDRVKELERMRDQMVVLGGFMSPHKVVTQTETGEAPPKGETEKPVGQAVH